MRFCRIAFVVALAVIPIDTVRRGLRALVTAIFALALDHALAGGIFTLAWFEKIVARCQNASFDVLHLRLLLEIDGEGTPALGCPRVFGGR